MAPPPKGADKMKQKSLTSFFGKKDAAASTPAAPVQPKSKPSVAATPQKPKAKSHNTENLPMSSPAAALRTPLPKVSSQSSGVMSATYTRSSDGGQSAFETPPTSDPIDVDMASSDVDASGGVQRSAGKSVRIHSQRACP